MGECENGTNRDLNRLSDQINLRSLITKMPKNRFPWGNSLLFGHWLKLTVDKSNYKHTQSFCEYQVFGLTTIKLIKRKMIRKLGVIKTAHKKFLHEIIEKKTGSWFPNWKAFRIIAIIIKNCFATRNWLLTRIIQRIPLKSKIYSQ